MYNKEQGWVVNKHLAVLLILWTSLFFNLKPRKAADSMLFLMSCLAFTWQPLIHHNLISIFFLICRKQFDVFQIQHHTSQYSNNMKLNQNYQV